MTDDCVQSFLDFVNVTGSPYHAVDACLEKLKESGFEHLEGKKWQELRRGGRYYVTAPRHATVMAFVVGEQWNVEHGGFVIAGSHTDSPCLRIRPNHSITSEGYQLLGLQLYGGGIWRTWFDHGLGFAGTAIIKNQNGNFETRLVRVAKPVALIPNLAIHLTDPASRNEFKFSTEDHLRPVLAVAATESDTNTVDLLKSLVAKELDVPVDTIASMDLCLFDATPARVWGANDEFIESGRLDNLIAVWAGVEAIRQVKPENLKDIAVMVAWDHEEIGSCSCSGADGALLRNWLERIYKTVKYSSETCFEEIMERSFILSTDGAHGVHPNYPEKHQRQHKPILNAGVVVKENANQRYCTVNPDKTILTELVPQGTLQPFVVRNDSPCGSTIGPLATALLAVPGVDVGVPMWAMHSIRESAGVKDLKYLLDLTREVLQKYGETAKKFKGLY